MKTLRIFILSVCLNSWSAMAAQEVDMKCYIGTLGASMPDFEFYLGFKEIKSFTHKGFNIQAGVDEFRAWVRLEEIKTETVADAVALDFKGGNHLYQKLVVKQAMSEIHCDGIAVQNN